MGTFSQVTFIRLEKMKVTHQMNLAEAARLKFYDKLNFAQQSQQEQTITEYKRMQKHFVNLQLLATKLTLSFDWFGSKCST